MPPTYAWAAALGSSELCRDARSRFLLRSVQLQPPFLPSAPPFKCMSSLSQIIIINNHHHGGKLYPSQSYFLSTFFSLNFLLCKPENGFCHPSWTFLTATRFGSGLVCFHLTSLGSRRSFIAPWYCLVSPFALEKGKSFLILSFLLPGIIFWKYPVPKIMFSRFYRMLLIQNCLCFTRSSSTPPTLSKVCGGFILCRHVGWIARARIKMQLSLVKEASGGSNKGGGSKLLLCRMR